MMGQIRRATGEVVGVEEREGVDEDYGGSY
jgi:hypothetical protein